jgi:hypothetical protein
MLTDFLWFQMKQILAGFLMTTNTFHGSFGGNCFELECNVVFSAHYASRNCDIVRPKTQNNTPHRERLMLAQFGANDLNRPVGARVRVVDNRQDLCTHAIEPSDLLQTAVLVKAAVFAGASTPEAVPEVFAWMPDCREHPLWSSGVWTCSVGDSDQVYEGQRTPPLRFHTDLSRRTESPEYTVIRSITADPSGAGVNLLIHVDDTFQRLEERRDHRLFARHRLNIARIGSRGRQPAKPDDGADLYDYLPQKDSRWK